MIVICLQPRVNIIFIFLKLIEYNKNYYLIINNFILLNITNVG